MARWIGFAQFCNYLRVREPVRDVGAGLQALAYFRARDVEHRVTWLYLRDRYIFISFFKIHHLFERQYCDSQFIGMPQSQLLGSIGGIEINTLTVLTRTCVIAEHLLHKYGFERRCRGVHGTDIPVLALEDGGLACLPQIEDAAREALARDRSGAIVLGCAGMAGLCRALQQRLGVPVIDGVGVAVRLAHSLHTLGLGTSKRGDYAPPLPKPYSGWAADLAACPQGR